MSVMDILIRAQDQASAVLNQVQGEIGEVGTAAEEAASRTSTAMDRAAESMGSTGRKLTLGVTLPIVGAGIAALRSLGRIEVIGAQTEAVIKATGGAAGVSADQVLGLADAIEATTGIESESVQEGENLLLTFKNIQNGVGEGNDIFNQATASLVDMATAMHTDSKSAAIQLGKALNDPIAGVTALTRVGVSFTDEQKAMIQSLVESGDVMGAQKIILGELNSEFGGSAEALGDTMQGRINKVMNGFGTMGETLATMVLPFIEKLTSWLQRVSDWFNNLSPGAQKIIGLLIGLAAAVGPVLIVASKLIQAFKVVKEAFAALNLVFAVNPFVILIAAVVALVIIIVTNWDTIKEYLIKAWTWIKDTAASIWNGIKDFFTGIWTAITDALTSAWNAIKDFFTGLWEGITSSISTAWNAIKDFFSDLFGKIWDNIVTVWDNIFGFFKGLPTKAITALWDFSTRVLTWILEHHPLVILFNKAVEFWPEVSQWFKDLPGKILDALGDLSHLLYDIGKKIITGLWDGLKAAWNDVTGWVSGIGGWIADHKGPLEVDATLLTPHGKLIMGGLLKGLQREWPAVADFVTSRGAELSVGLDGARPALSGVGGAGSTDLSGMIGLLRDQNDLLKRILEKTGFSIDGRDLVDALGRPLVDEIRARTGL